MGVNPPSSPRARPLVRRTIPAARRTCQRVGTTEESPVADLAYTALLVASFAVLALTLRGMEKL